MKELAEKIFRLQRRKDRKLSRVKEDEIALKIMGLVHQRDSLYNKQYEELDKAFRQAGGYKPESLIMYRTLYALDYFTGGGEEDMRRSVETIGGEGLRRLEKRKKAKLIKIYKGTIRPIVEKNRSKAGAYNTIY